MAKIVLNHPNIDDNQKSFISIDYSSGTTIYVNNTAGFNSGDFVLLGRYGSPQSEIVQIQSIVSYTQILLVNSANFPHSSDTPMTFIPWDQWKVYRSITGIGGTYSLLSGFPDLIQADMDKNIGFDNASQPTYSYKLSFYNSSKLQESSFSQELLATGYQSYTLKEIEDSVLELFGDPNERFLNRRAIDVWVNQIYRKMQLAVVGSESPYFVNSISINGNGGSSYSIANYNMLQIFMVELSRDGGLTWKDTITPKDFRLKDASGSITMYDYRLVNNTLLIEPALPSGVTMRIWYLTEPVSLSSPTDQLSNPFKSFSDVCIDYALMRAHEKDRKMAEMAAYYRNRVDSAMDEYNGAIKKMKERIKQGNKVMATTWADDTFFGGW
jgi:hypothetical protein